MLGRARAGVPNPGLVVLAALTGVGIAACAADSSQARARRHRSAEREERPQSTPPDAPSSAGPDAAAGAAGHADPPAAAERSDAIDQRARRLGLGTHTTAVHLFVGPAPAAWVEEAGGTDPPGDLLWPIDGGRWMRGYAAGRLGDPHGTHRGIDIETEEGSPIYASAPGLVGYAGNELRAYGNVVLLLHPAGWVTVYAHASELLVKPGQMVQGGDVIARVGHSGNAGSDHIHYELRRDGHKVNPLPFLRGAPERVRDSDPLPLPRHVRVYRVKEPTRLWRLARGSGMSPPELAKLNGLHPRDPLLVGHRLLIAPRPRTP